MAVISGRFWSQCFLRAGHEVVGLDTHLYRSCTFGAEPVVVPEIVKDLRDVEASDLKGFDAVVHLAALSNDPLGNLDPQLTFDINHLGRCGWRAKPKKRAFPASCSRHPAALTARPGTTCWMRPAASTR